MNVKKENKECVREISYWNRVDSGEGMGRVDGEYIFEERELLKEGRSECIRKIREETKVERV